MTEQRERGSVSGKVDDTESALASEISERIRSLSLDEKIRMMTIPTVSHLESVEKIGLGAVVVGNGPCGVRRRQSDEREPSQNVPCPAALGATWDEDLVERMGIIMAHDARDKGVDVVFAPCVNLQRSPYSGRHFEYFSEDPLLTGRLGAACVRGLQDMGVGATVKHFVANDSETERQTVDVVVDERTLRELYMAPFEFILQTAPPWLVMSSYNSVNGERMSESRLLRDILKEEWGFDGVVISDFFATPSTVEAAASGLDLVLPWPRGGARAWNELLAEAVRSGELDESILDDKIARLLRLGTRCGLLEGASAKPLVPSRDLVNETEDIRAAAAAGFVLARNEGPVLPLDKDTIGSVAVLGPNATRGRANGGGSVEVYPVHVVSPLEGITRAAGEKIKVWYAEGVRPYHWHPVAEAPWLRQGDRDEDGVKVDFLDKTGAVLASERRNTGEFSWTVDFADGVAAADVAQVRVTGEIVAQESGRHQVGVSGVGRYSIALGDGPAVEVRHVLKPGADITEGFTFPPQRMFDVDLAEGESVDLEITHEVGTFKVGSPLTMFQIRLATPFGNDDEELERAVELAASADAAVVVIGNDIKVDAEGIDRDDLKLPGRQDELVRRVVAVNPRTVVVVNTASPTVLTWAEEVPTVLLAWLPGQEFGDALAEVLFGVREPGGRLPMTWPRTESGLAAVKPVGGILRYSEGLLMGYRGAGKRARDPQWAFGHGLGYTSWLYAGLEVDSRSGADADAVTVSIRVRNTGERAGKETVQVYLSKPDSQIERPVRWLAGFANIVAAPDEEVVVRVDLSQMSLRHWTQDGWSVEPGEYLVHVGRSSDDLLLSTEVDLG